MTGKSSVLHFIEQEREKGTDDQAIQRQLLDAGWHIDIVHRIMNPETSTYSGGTTMELTYMQQLQTLLATPYGIAAACFALFMLLVLI